MSRLLHQELLLSQNTDVLGFCPHPDHHDLLAVGTYELPDRETQGADAAANHRLGSVSLYTLNVPQQQLQLHKRRDTAGVFDLKWTRLGPDRVALGLALTSGSVELVGTVGQVQLRPYSCDPTTATQPGRLIPPRSLQEELATISSCVVDDQAMVASLAWDTECPSHCAAATSAGGVAVLKVTDGGLSEVASWQGHDLEAWSVAFDSSQPNILYSGADDCTFKGWDIRAASETGEAAPVFTNRKAHSAGITAICCDRRTPHQLLTGSYDEHIRTWDLRMLARPVVDSEVATGGGVWRLQWHPADPTLLLAACMYNGFHILRKGSEGSVLEPVEAYTAHQSIAYGASWYHGCWNFGGGGGHEGLEVQRTRTGSGGSSREQTLQQHEGEQQGGGAPEAQGPDAGRDSTGGGGGDGDGQPCLVATCSFYDNRLHLWTPGTRSRPVAKQQA